MPVLSFLGLFHCLKLFPSGLLLSSHLLVFFVLVTDAFSVFVLVSADNPVLFILVELVDSIERCLDPVVSGMGLQVLSAGAFML